MKKDHRWKDSFLFEGLNEAQLTGIEPLVFQVEFDRKTQIMKEGDAGTFVFILSEGSAEVYKNELKLTDLLPGDLVGLMALIDTKPRSATVLAGEEGAKGFSISRDAFMQILQDSREATASVILMNYLKYQQDTIRNTNELSLSEARARLEVEKKRVLSGRFFAQMVLGQVIFTFCQGFLYEKAHNTESTYISFVVLGVYSIWSWFFMRHSSLPLEAFGLTMKNIVPALKLMIPATLVFIIGLFLLKWVMISFFPQAYGNDLIDFFKTTERDATPIVVILSLYIVHAIFQEFIARACIQGGLQQFIAGKRSVLYSIVLATLMFSSFHLMIELNFALITIIPSMFWGYLFSRQRSLPAVAISHIIIGIVALFVLNIAG